MSKKQIVEENVELLLETRIVLKKYKMKIVQHTVYFYQIKKKNKGYVNIYPTTRKVLWADTLHQYLSPLQKLLQLRVNWNIMDIAKKVTSLKENQR